MSSGLQRAERAFVIVIVILNAISSACITRSDAQLRVVVGPMGDGALLARDLPTLRAIVEGQPILPSSAIWVPDGTTGKAIDRKFLQRGQLVEPYPATGNDMKRNGAVEVVLLQITNGPRKGLDGWIIASRLRPSFRYL